MTVYLFVCLFIYLFPYQFVKKNANTSFNFQSTLSVQGTLQPILSTTLPTVVFFPVNNLLGRIWTSNNPGIIYPVIAFESAVTSRSLSPTLSLPSRAAAPSPLILVTKILGSPGTYGLSLPPRMLKPRPLPKKKK